MYLNNLGRGFLCHLRLSHFVVILSRAHSQLPGNAIFIVVELGRSGRAMRWKDPHQRVGKRFFITVLLDCVEYTISGTLANNVQMVMQEDQNKTHINIVASLTFISSSDLPSWCKSIRFVVRRRGQSRMQGIVMWCKTTLQSRGFIFRRTE